MQRRALFIGINRYGGHGNDLTTPGNDAQALYQLFREHNFDGTLDIYPRTGGQGDDLAAIDPNGYVAKAGLIKCLKQFFSPEGKPDTILLYFSGHADKRTSEDDLTGEKSSELCLCSSDDQYAVPLPSLLTLLDRSGAREIMVWLDCCHSGGMMNFGSLFHGRNGFFLASSLPNEPSYQGKKEHSILTQALVEELRHLAQGGNRVTAMHLALALENRLRNQIQTFNFGLLNSNITLFYGSNQGDDWKSSTFNIPLSVRQQGYFDRYLRVVSEEWKWQSVETVDPNPTPSPSPILLSEVYLELPVQETATVSPRETPRTALGNPTLFDILTLQDSRRTVLCGELGSGKSTVVRHLCHILALACLGETSSNRNTLPLGLPVRIVLGEIGTRIPQDANQATSNLIWQFVKSEFQRRLSSEAEGTELFDALYELLRQHGIFFFDGLDEVPDTNLQRRNLIQALIRFAEELGGARILVTTRPYALSSASGRFSFNDFSLLELGRLDPIRREQFVQRWYRSVQRVEHWDDHTREKIEHELQRALRERTYLAELGSRPLLLTLIASLHAANAQLPEDRAELYKSAVGLLLSRWYRHLGDRSDALLTPEFAGALRMGAESIRIGLQKLAFDLHLRQQNDAAARISKTEVGDIFAKVLPQNRIPMELGEFLSQRAGLLVLDSNGGYDFPHRSFREFLAACHIVDTDQEPHSSLVKLVHENADWWREVFLLALGKVSQGGMANAIVIIESLLPAEPDKVAVTSEQHWRDAALGGLALVELRIKERFADYSFASAIVQRVSAWLACLLQEGHLPPRERAEAGDCLAKLGDPRRGVTLDAEGLPDIEWVEISPGWITTAESCGNVPAFKIARYPVTVTQYGAFVAGKCYALKEYWSAQGWYWRVYRNRITPAAWEEQINFPNRPVVGISWHEAVAFCNWLSEKRQQTIRLPSEEEWEYAAAGEQGRGYPWGETAEPLGQWANTAESQIGHPSAVGMYPKGSTPEGVMELAGNVWEWCGNRYADASISDKKNRIDAEARGERPLRGGSWWAPTEHSRCAKRKSFQPAAGDPDVGFRLVYDLASSKQPS